MHAWSLLQALAAANARGNSQTSSPSPALDLNDPGTVQGIFSDAAGHVYNTRDPHFPMFLNAQSDPTTLAVANATANLANQIDGATSLSQIGQIQNSAQGTVIP